MHPRPLRSCVRKETQGERRVIVLDASAVIELLLGGTRGRLVEGWLTEHEGELHAPSLVDVESAQAFRRLASSGRITSQRGQAAIEILQELPIERHGTRALLPRIWELRLNLTAYDAAYAALGEALACPVVTFDERLASAPGLKTEVAVPA